MSEQETLLADVPLVADPDASKEMGAADVEAIADEDIKGSRLLLVRRVVEPIDLDGTAGGVVQLVCTFQPAEGTRFSSAQFRLRLATPAGLRVVDLAPRVIDDAHPVEITIDKKGKLGLNIASVPLEPSIEIGSSKKYVRYHCAVQGSGAGTNLARWDFRENPDRQDGIGREQVLTLTLSQTGAVTGNVIVSARLVRSGLRGRIEAIRDMIVGSDSGDRTYPIALEVPKAPSPDGLSSFFKLF
ncbi:MAG TPA: hypothetical protein VJT15_04965 [Pyrinomonadaceae bacterium]|nr:hypothetical protein [Pyrinomonadaceae bacterium]